MICCNNLRHKLDYLKPYQPGLSFSRIWAYLAKLPLVIGYIFVEVFFLVLNYLSEDQRK